MKIYLAGWFGIPCVLITGDEAACREGKSYVPGVELIDGRKTRITGRDFMDFWSKWFY